MKTTDVQEMQDLLRANEAEKASLRDTLMQTETLIKQARVEHQDELLATAASSRAELADMKDRVHELSLAVRFCIAFPCSACAL
jgi:hypothetical protein